MVKIKKEKIPTSPGVYFFKDKNGNMLYVGKATSLKNRISSYFVKNNGLSPAKHRLLDEAATVTWEETPSEIEALLQESHYIKKYQPRFNVLLRDDKTYLSVKITDEEYPRVLTTRKIEKDGTYFGPFTDARAVKETLKILRRFFPYRTNCVPNNDRACLYYHLGLCPGVCIGKISLQEYRQNIKYIKDFFAGKRQRILNNLKRQLKMLRRMRDEPSLKRAENVEPYEFTPVAPLHIFRRAEPYEAYPASPRLRRVPSSRIHPVRSKASNGVHPWVYPPRADGFLRRRVEYKIENLEKVLAMSHILSFGEKIEGDIIELAKVLDLKKPPHRIEGYDVSNIMGTLATASMVVFTAGQTDKSQYRKFKIKTVHGANDVAMLKEILRRRFNHYINQEIPSSISIKNPPSRPPHLVYAMAYTRWGKEKSKNKQGSVWPKPDLVVVDGGRPQLGAAMEVWREFKLDIPIVSLAKRLEEIFVPNQLNPIVLPRTSGALHLLQRVRDEAHRFAVSYHKVLRRKQLLFR